MGHEKSNFDHHITTERGVNVAVIMDRGGPFMSVTNNAEAVMAHIQEESAKKWKPVKVFVYQDTSGNWDGLNPGHKDGHQLFYHLGGTMTEAISKAVSTYLASVMEAFRILMEKNSYMEKVPLEGTGRLLYRTDRHGDKLSNEPGEKDYEHAVSIMRGVVDSGMQGISAKVGEDGAFVTLFVQLAGQA